MTFSLMSLITILALSFAVSPVMAVDFKVMIEGPRVVTYAADSETTAIEIDLMVTSEEALPEPLTIGTVAAGVLTAGSNNITGEVRDNRGFITTLWGDARVTVVDDPVATFAARTVKKRQLSVSITPQTAAGDPIIDQVKIIIPAFETPDTRVGDDHDMSTNVEHTILVREEGDVNYDADDAKVVSIQRLRPGSQAAVAAFQDEKISPEVFDIRVVLTEMRFDRIALADKTPDQLAADLVKVDGGKAENLRVGTPFARAFVGDAPTVPITAANDTTIKPHPNEGRYSSVTGTTNALPGLPPTAVVPAPTGLDNLYHEYRVRIVPQKRRGDYTLKVSVKGFADYSPTLIGEKPNGREELRIPVSRDLRALEAGYRVTIGKDIVIPAGGYLIITRDSLASEIVVPAGRLDRSPMAHERRPAQMLYNVIQQANLPNLASNFQSGVVIDVEYGTNLVISEVMWGADDSLYPPARSQWIELYNPGGEHKTVGDNAATFDIDERLTLVFYGANEFSAVPPKTAVAATATTPATMALPDRVQDRIGTLGATGAYWNPNKKGQSGASGTLHIATGLNEDIERTLAPSAVIVPLVSMYRVMDDTGAVKDGQMEANWMSSQRPKSANFNPGALGIRHGTPGAATDAIDTPADTEAEAQAKADAKKAEDDKIANTGTYPMAGDGRVYISEVMFAGGGTLPQWIEISNGDRAKAFNLSGWTITIDNAIADADVSVSSGAKFTIPNGTTIDPSAQDDTPSTILVVTETGRNNLTGAKASGQIVNLAVDNEIDLITAGVLRGKYTLLSDMAFLITLAPPEPAATKAPAGETAAAKTLRQANEKKASVARKVATDMVGNLGADGAAAWALPMSEEGGRSSIIRKHIQVARGPAAPEDGMMAENWVLASDTSFAQVTHIRASSYYGAANDVGTPGFRAGGALPVELSHFRPTRNKDTGQVVITWSTQSELNNAGFFIKRSQQKDGEFQVINATMVAGAGTTSEKQFYTYTDTTAQPNVVYYYQIEDVSLDGNRQTLTRGIRLKGHVSVAGKATLTWGELKSSNE